MILILVGSACLSGCAVVGPLLSVGGMAGLAPLQYASTAYTLGEFTYEYAANDKDPGEVIRAKIDGVVSGDAFRLPDASDGYDSRPGFDAPQPRPDAMMATVRRVRSGDGDAARTASAPPMLASVEATAVPSNLSDQARQRRIEQLLGRRADQFNRLETRRMAFRQARERGQLSLRQNALAAPPNLFLGAVGETTLRQ